MTLSEAYIDSLRTVARIQCIDDNIDAGDDIDIGDISGHNYDDAYELGKTSGEVALAREILHYLGVEY